MYHNYYLFTKFSSIEYDWPLSNVNEVFENSLVLMKESEPFFILESIFIGDLSSREISHCRRPELFFALAGSGTSRVID